ncbi:LysR substrate-binding domain-containing protein [Loktanella sp. S4079]|uniref:LysR substrate-binding domain-containing protein n=1 Tax=Loktanella sp. S4079 TaxID=579483 RepID=UPI0005F9D9FA|nr:LysR substrate-binding domain-containing protein [Loktanella sp. S4079]KJZ18602.1 LysR family transcriptional regulator [Loktanella sp. S4079]
MARPYDLPSMSALLCFEAAARHLSFKQAASELNVTPTAVSHQIRNLEADLDRQLFERGHRGVDLTEIGAYLFVAVQKALSGVSDTVKDVRMRSDRDDVVVGLTTAMSAFWLTPLITDFWKEHPEIVVSQSVSDVGPGTEQVDISLNYGEMPDDDSECYPLFWDRIVALGAPEFARNHAIDGLDALRAAPLIHFVSEGEWTGWEDWFAALDHPKQSGRQINVNSYMIAIQLAQDGAGAVLGWQNLVRPLLRSGRLVPLVQEDVTSPFPYYLKLHAGAPPQARIFCDWLIAHQGQPHV